MEAWRAIGIGHCLRGTIGAIRSSSSSKQVRYLNADPDPGSSLLREKFKHGLKKYFETKIIHVDVYRI
jgi:hypothetical protein